MKKDTPFVVSPQHSGSILFDETHSEEWIHELASAPHITDFYIVSEKKASFDKLKSDIGKLLGPLRESAEQKRSMSDGFAENVEYFRLDFLDKDHVALGRQFREIIPVLWLRAGGIGKRPELPKNKPLPDFMIPPDCPFAVLTNESKFRRFVEEIKKRIDLTHVYLVTDSQESFTEMASRISVPNVIQLYRDYLENFVINKGGDE